MAVKNRGPPSDWCWISSHAGLGGIVSPMPAVYTKSFDIPAEAIDQFAHVNNLAYLRVDVGGRYRAFGGAGMAA